MPQPRPRTTKPAAVRRTELLDAAAALFAERGFDAVAVGDITERAGVAKGTFYLYFDSREALLEALRHRLSEDVAHALAELPPPGDRDGWKAFTARLVERAIGLAVERHDLHELVRRLPHHDPADHGGGGIRGRIEEVIRVGIDAGAYDVDDAGTTAALVFDLLHAAGDRACADPSQRAGVITATTTAVIRMLGVRDGR